jgi:hypothetical protein
MEERKLQKISVRLTVIFMFISVCGCLTELRGPNVLLGTYYPNHRIVAIKDLNQDVQQYFREEYVDSDPGCIEEDFDGDGIVDYALLLRTDLAGKAVERFVVLKGEGKDRFTPINLIESHQRIGDSFLRLVPSGTVVRNSAGTETVTLNRPGFEIVLFESASRVYFWESGKFRFVQTSD